MRPTAPGSATGRSAYDLGRTRARPAAILKEICRPPGDILRRMSELDVHLAAAYLKRVSLSSSALDELLEEEGSRKLRRVNSSNNLETGQNVGSTGVSPFDGSPKGKQPRSLRNAEDMRRVVSADDIRRAAPGFTSVKEETPEMMVSDDSNTSVPASLPPPTKEALDALLQRLEERRALGPVELGRCLELKDATDEFVRRGLFDALESALDRNVWSELGALVDVHRRARPYDLRDDLRRAICVNREVALNLRLHGDTEGALEAMRELKKCQWQLVHVGLFVRWCRRRGQWRVWRWCAKHTGGCP